MLLLLSISCCCYFITYLQLLLLLFMVLGYCILMLLLLSVSCYCDCKNLSTVITAKIASKSSSCTKFVIIDLICTCNEILSFYCCSSSNPLTHRSLHRDAVSLFKVVWCLKYNLTNLIATFTQWCKNQRCFLPFERKMTGLHLTLQV